MKGLLCTIGLAALKILCSNLLSVRTPVRFRGRREGGSRSGPVGQPDSVVAESNYAARTIQLVSARRGRYDRAMLKFATFASG